MPALEEYTLVGAAEQLQRPTRCAANESGSDFEASLSLKEIPRDSQDVRMFFEHDHDDACDPEGKRGKRGYN